MKSAVGMDLPLPDQAVEHRDKFSAAVVAQCDPQKITDLIKQLDRDLVETKKNTSKRR
ncbi:MAG TPA: hypothetical protein VIW67_25955 [Terriglobales bacterium]|jgi:hypothetical protein